MTVTRLRRHRAGTASFGRARLSSPTRVLLAVLRGYAVIGILVAVYSFFHAVR